MFFGFFSPLSIAITSFGEERANLSVFRIFVRFALVWICLFLFPLGVWEGLRRVIVALPGLFCYLFFIDFNFTKSGVKCHVVNVKCLLRNHHNEVPFLFSLRSLSPFHYEKRIPLLLGERERDGERDRKSEREREGGGGGVCSPASYISVINVREDTQEMQ